MITSGGRVLILDDDAAVGRSIALFVEFLGMQAKSVCQPEIFFTTIKEWNPTHIILDLLMPGKDGVEILQILADLKCNSRIAISSGVGSRILNAARQSGSEHGLDIAGVFPKPFKLEALRSFLYEEDESVKMDSELAHTEITITRIELLEAAELQQFHVMYQPKVFCRTEVVTGFEALVRWDHPTWGAIPPSLFIPFCENLGLVGLITEQVVEQSLAWYRSTPAVHGLSLSLNISAKTLEDTEFTEWLEGMCKQSQVSPEFVVLEVTETAALVDQLAALDLFTRLRMKGFQVSIDDFGTGNSTLALLARLPFSEIKVDRSFAMTATSSEESRAIIKSTVDLGHSLDLSVVVEGVEDKETFQFLQEVNCDLAQGFYISRPMAGSQVSDWMAQYRHQHAS